MRRAHSRARGHHARLSSLAALAGAAVATGAGSAQAAVVSGTFSGLSVSVGVQGTANHQTIAAMTGVASASVGQARFKFAATFVNSGQSGHGAIKGRVADGYFVATAVPPPPSSATGALALIVAAGATPPASTIGAAFGPRAGFQNIVTQRQSRNSTTTSHSGGIVTHHATSVTAFSASTRDYASKYALFTFKNGGTTDHGWVELSLSTANDVSTLNILAAAYDNTGAVLPAGSLGAPAPVPEPGSLPIEASGLAALALGATAHRRWRAARKARAAA